MQTKRQPKGTGSNEIIVCFRFDEFDEAIDEAIEDDIKEADGGGRCLSCCSSDKLIHLRR